MTGKRVLMIAGDYVEDYEIMVPFQALCMVGYEVHVVCPNRSAGESIRTAVHDFEDGVQTYVERRGHNFKLNASFDKVKSENYDALLIPGGRAPEYIRLNSRVQELAREFNDAKKPIAAICHGALVLLAAGILPHRTLTAYSACGPDIKSCGANFKEVGFDEVIVDSNLVTTPTWLGHAGLLAKFISLLGTKVVQQ